MTKVIIVDDEPLASGIVKEYLENHADIEIAEICHDGFEGVKAIQRHKPELVFLDIQMPRITGFEMLELIENRPHIIFTTAFDEYALKAFENHAVDYLLKPFSKERFDKALQKFRQINPKEESEKLDNLVRSENNIPDQKGRVVVKTGGRIRIIPVNEIFYIQASDDYVEIYTVDAHFLKSKTMTYFENTLPKDMFVRVHRSWIININEILRIEPYEKDGHVIILKNNARIPVSRSGYALLRQVLGL